jgi:hydrogenase expression/formation protein HypC
MCLGVPGKVVSVAEAADSLSRSGRVSFGGVVKEVSLAFVPDVQVGEYVIVHAGFALNKLDETEATRIFTYLQQMDELE